MATLKFKRTIVQTINKVVPDYFGCDDSPLGRAVDYLLGDHPGRGRSARDRIYDEEDGERAVEQLERAYDQARGVAYALGVLSKVGGEVHGAWAQKWEDELKRKEKP